MTTAYPLRYTKMVTKQNLTAPLRQSGFTLLELSVVIAIIGMLIGGVLATQSYLRTASLTTTLNESRYYINAVQQFQKIYGGQLPGDMSNATQYWGDGGGCWTTLNSGTCNGDGNGLILYYSTHGEEEVFLTFHHLKLANLIKGNYTGLTGGQAISNPGSSAASDAVPGQNVPLLSTANVSLYFTSMPGDGFMAGHDAYPDGNYGPFFATLGGIYYRGYWPGFGFMSPQEAYEMDSKFDNGVPYTGWIRSRNTTFSDCAANASSYSTADSKLSNECYFFLIPQ